MNILGGRRLIQMSDSYRSNKNINLASGDNSYNNSADAYAAYEKGVYQSTLERDRLISLKNQKA